MDQAVRYLRKYYEVETSNFVPVCFISNQTIFKLKTEKPKSEKIRGIQGLNVQSPVQTIAAEILLGDHYTDICKSCSSVD